MFTSPNRRHRELACKLPRALQITQYTVYTANKASDMRKLPRALYITQYTVYTANKASDKYDALRDVLLDQTIN